MNIKLACMTLLFLAPYYGYAMQNARQQEQEKKAFVFDKLCARLNQGEDPMNVLIDLYLPKAVRAELGEIYTQKLKAFKDVQERFNSQKKQIIEMIENTSGINSTAEKQHAINLFGKWVNESMAYQEAPAVVVDRPVVNQQQQPEREGNPNSWGSFLWGALGY